MSGTASCDSASTQRYRRAGDRFDSVSGGLRVFHCSREPRRAVSVSLAERFATAVAAEATADGRDDGQLLPARLARAAARLLEVDAAGLSVMVGPVGRLPLVASSPDAEQAERLQFTAGEGPCLLAHDSGQPVFAVEEDLRHRWPVFGDLLLTSTPFHGVVSLPLRWALAGVGAMDLFFCEPREVARLDVFDALAVGDLVVSALGDAAVW